MSETPGCKVFIIDDDQSVRYSISLLLKTGGYQVETFNDVKEFIDNEGVAGPGCILLDIFLDGESGLELQHTITEKFKNIPIIYITGHGDIPMSVQALRRGAVNFLQKPVEEEQLFNAVAEAISISQEMIKIDKEKEVFTSLVDSLTPREFEIFRYVLKGMLNKQIASELNIAEHTVKLHRGRITEKLGVKSVPELINIAKKANIL